MTRLLPPLLAVLAAIWASRVVNPAELGKRIERMEGGIRRVGPWLAAVFTVAAVWWTWGHLQPIPTTHDESSYLLQARIFAHGAWTAASPPIPEFFEQPQVLVVPAVASKFPPGHALLLALGAIVQFPPLVPLLVAACTAALIIVVGSRIANPWIAMLAWVIWLATPLVMRFQGSYFAEGTATLMVLATWWCFLEWRDTRRWPWVLGLALAAGWGAITDAATTVAFGLPLLIVFLVDAFRARTWLAPVILIPVVALVLGIIPLWSAQTTGDKALTPTALYARDYVPFDKMGFTIDGGAPNRTLTPVMLSLRDELLQQHEAQQPNRLPMTFARRLAAIAGDLWQGAQLILIPFFAIGLASMNTPMRVGLVSALLLIVGRIFWAQDPTWTLPYLSIAPVIAGITACGIWRVLVWASSGLIVRLHIDRRPKMGSALVALVLAFFAVPTFGAWRIRNHQANAMREAFDDAMKQLPSSKSIVFLRYAPRRQHMSLVFNYPDPQREPVWVVHDLGERNRELLALAQDRTAYVFDERTMEFRRF